MSTVHQATSAVEVAEREFHTRFPDFDPTQTFDDLRRSEYGRLDAGGHVYLDYTGGGLYAASQIQAHTDLLRSSVLGNPHSDNPSSEAATTLVESARRVVLEFFRAPAEDYLCVFTANATGALRLVGESYRFVPGGTYALTYDNHNSVNGIREFARRKGAAICYVPVQAPELRIDRSAMSSVLGGADPSANNLFAFPAQSNYSGVQHDLGLIAEAHAAGWDVLLDAAAFVPTNRLDVSRLRPDFVTMSFYKMMGFPTGVGCLLVRRDRLDVLERPWFAGGTITIASVQGDGHHLQPDEAGFEDGTLDYLNLPAVEVGLRHLERVGVDRIHRRVECLTSWLLDGLRELRHADGQPLVHVHGPTDTTGRGGTVSFFLRDRDGRPIDDRTVEKMAGEAGISLRTGCFCNPGAGEVAHGLGRREMAAWFEGDEPGSFYELRDHVLSERSIYISAIRVSVGVATTFGDVHRLVSFLAGFLDRTAGEVGRVGTSHAEEPPSRDAS